MLQHSSICPYFYIVYERSIILVLRQEEWLVVDDPFYMKCWAKLTPFLQKRRFSIDIRS